MTGEMIAFFILALVAICGGVFMIHSENVVHMVVSLIFTFLSIAGIYILLSAEFVAVVQVLIYSGAITIIMLFGIMLTKHDPKSEKRIAKSRILAVGTGVVAFFIIMFLAINKLSFKQQDVELYVHNVKKIGIELYSKYVIPFELTSILLLVALIGAVVLAKKDESEEMNEHE
ncbi:NADH-quinone oxidoreductase subunit J [Fictibacillus sp. Mic-4]|uniref:NADH-quinone oxidoreductase subunit J n=1 Tax=Fictibacillus TaxID=1329200 RepID=UPI00040D1A89|nr:NADH-quinone oxidoreductase subunit J [Fictibacillus gelatini]